MLERVKEIIQEQLNLDGVEITEESSFKDDLGVDSLDLFELVMAFEEEYQIEIPSEDLDIPGLPPRLLWYRPSGPPDWCSCRSESFRLLQSSIPCGNTSPQIHRNVQTPHRK